MSYRGHRTQGGNGTVKTGRGILLLALLAALVLAGCGKRPSQVDPPPGSDGKAVTYPAPEVMP